MHVPGSFAQKLRLRSEIRGLITRYGMPAFWITINPSDLRNPIILILAGIEYSRDNLATVNTAVREATTTSNPAAVAEFFHYVYKAVLEGLFATNTSQIGILSDLSNHFAVIKTNGRVYYITNYATKDDVSPWQMVAKAALLKQSIKKAKVAEPPTATDLRLREKGVNNFALRCFNALSHDREISGVQVASALLQLPTYYTINYNFIHINL
ncbi:hypothetical protein PoHVEF18_010583 [Penicillium ochrochloron]